MCLMYPVSRLYVVGIVGLIQYIPCRISTTGECYTMCSRHGLVTSPWNLECSKFADIFYTRGFYNVISKGYSQYKALHMHTWRLVGTRGAAGVEKIMGSVKY